MVISSSPRRGRDLVWRLFVVVVGGAFGCTPDEATSNATGEVTRGVDSDTASSETQSDEPAESSSTGGDGNETAEPPSPTTTTTSEVDTGSLPSCDDAACEEVDGCVDDPCFDGVVCTDIVGGDPPFACGACPPGFEGDGVDCLDIDGCASARCFGAVDCTDVPAPDTGRVCGPCPRGMRGNGETCTEVDGCAGDPCAVGVACLDVPAPGVGRICGDLRPCGGIAEVGCRPGGTCLDDPRDDCDPLEGDVNCPGVCSGRCPPGQIGDGITCLEEDGCGLDPCFPGVRCEDVPAPGSGRECGVCPPGFEGDGDVCRDVDGCELEPCFADVTCTDVPAPDTGRSCGPCPQCFEGDGATCARIDFFAGVPVEHEFRVRQGETLERLTSVGLLAELDVSQRRNVEVVEETRSLPSGAALELDADGGFRYVPRPEAWGTDAFSHTLEDPCGAQRVGRVRVHVTPTTIATSELRAGRGGFSISGDGESTSTGRSVSAAGDVDDDGFDDVIIGSPTTGPSGDVDDDGEVDFVGRAHVVFGGPAIASPVRLSDVGEGIGGFRIDGESVDGRVGIQVGTAGDVDGDDRADVLVSGSFGDRRRGRSYVLFGKADGQPIELADAVNGPDGFAIDGEFAGDAAGISLRAAGDVDNDGLRDFLVAATGFDDRSIEPVREDVGRAYVVFGSASPTRVSLSDVAEGVGGFAIDGEDPGDLAGTSVDGFGDIDGDGFDDIIVSAEAGGRDSAPRSGRTYVVLGRAGGARVSLADVARGTGGALVDGQQAGDESGHVARRAGDVNGDGRDDLVIAAVRGGSTGGAEAGRLYVIFGARPFRSLSLAGIVSGNGGFIIDGEEPGDHAGSDVSAAGDLDGDGLGDLVVGARDAAGFFGRVYVVLGKTDTRRVDLAAIREGRGGFAIEADGAGGLGTSVGPAGDVNGDGFLDLVIGQPNTTIGEAFVVFGGEFF